MRVSNVKLLPLEGKYYSTVLELTVNEDSPVKIKIVAQGKEPSMRELERGYYFERGMDHVEPQEAYELADAIVRMLRSYHT